MMGPWEIVGIQLTAIFATCTLFLSGYFMKKIFPLGKSSKEILPFIGLAVVFICFGVAHIFVTWFDYYRWVEGQTIIALFKLYVTLLMGSLAGLSFFAEYLLKKTKYIITIYIIVGIIILTFLPTVEQLNLYSVIFGAPLVFIAPYIWFFILKPILGLWKKRMILALLGLLCIAVGIAGRSDIITGPLGLPAYSFGTLLSVFGVLLLWYGLAVINTFSDLNWKEKMRELFIISHTGIGLYAFSFEKNCLLKESDLIAGGFSGIKLILEEMLKTNEHLKLIDYQKVKIMLEQGEMAMFILIIREDSAYLRQKLKLLSDEFHIFYKDALRNWTGDMAIFKPLQEIIQRIFELKNKSLEQEVKESF